MYEYIHTHTYTDTALGNIFETVVDMNLDYFIVFKRVKWSMTN